METEQRQKLRQIRRLLISINVMTAFIMLLATVSNIFASSSGTSTGHLYYGNYTLPETEIPFNFTIPLWVLAISRVGLVGGFIGATIYLGKHTRKASDILRTVVCFLVLFMVTIILWFVISAIMEA